MKKICFAVIVISVILSSFSAVACEGEHCKMLDGKILKIFKDYPDRFDSTEKNYKELDSLKKRDIYFSIEDNRLVPGSFCKLSDGSVAYWTEAGDTLSSIIVKYQGYCSFAEIRKIADSNGIDADKLAADDIIIVSQKTLAEIIIFLP